MIPEIHLKPVYSAVCANSHENTIKCCNQLLLYSNSKSVVVRDIHNYAKPPTILSGHTQQVNGQSYVQTLSPPDDKRQQSYLCHVISSSHDKTAIIWQLTTANTDQSIQYDILYRLTLEQPKLFTTRCAFLTEPNQFTIVTTDIDGDIHLWHDQSLIQSIATKFCYFDSRIHLCRNGMKLLFLAGSSNKVDIYQICQDRLEHLITISGHTDWVKCIDVFEIPTRKDEFLLASASQDSYIRVCRLKVIHTTFNHPLIRTTISQKILEQPQGSTHRLIASIETVLHGHKGIVHGLCWYRRQPDSIIQLLSCSADKTIVLWSSTIVPTNEKLKASESMVLDNSTDRTGVDADKNVLSENELDEFESCPVTAGVWKESLRVGETGETNLPMLSVCLAEDELTFFAHSLHGAIHSWTYDRGEWVPKAGFMGHFGPVTDLSWAPNGEYLLSASLDRTCRLHAVAKSDKCWHEMARPQVHGYEINCLSSIDFTTFASGADEKNIRIFRETQFALKSLEALAELSSDSLSARPSLSDMPLHAQLPALGLSNRGATCPYDIDTTEDVKGSQQNSWYEISKMVQRLANIDHLEFLPFEEILLQSTLWWEYDKIFGHANELHALAVNTTRTCLASASKANRPDLASISIWETNSNMRISTIEHHSLTITRLKFSPDNQFLLSVSRDRTWCLSENISETDSEGEELGYKKLVGTSKSSSNHERIIWDCCWTHDSKYFMTVSRDKKAVLWDVSALLKATKDDNRNLNDGFLNRSERLFNCSIQAVDSPGCYQTSIKPTCYIFVFGLEDGTLELHSIDTELDEKYQWHQLRSISLFHQSPIRRLAFQPTRRSRKIEKSKEYDASHYLSPSFPELPLLASAADDCIVKLTRLVCTTRNE